MSILKYHHITSCKGIAHLEINMPYHNIDCSQELFPFFVEYKCFKAVEYCTNGAHNWVGQPGLGERMWRPQPETFNLFKTSVFSSFWSSNLSVAGELCCWIDTFENVALQHAMTTKNTQKDPMKKVLKYLLDISLPKAYCLFSSQTQ